MKVADLEALFADDSALCVLVVRRGVEREGDRLVQGYTLQLHRYAEHAPDTDPAIGIVQQGTHVLVRGATLPVALQALLDKLDGAA